MLVSPTEPFPIKGLGKVSTLPENYGADILIIAQGQRTGIQRKQFPGDFVASLADGRLYEQVHQMKALDRGVLIIEGFGQWTGDGSLLDDRIRLFTKTQLRGLIFSFAWEFDLQVILVRDIKETMATLVDLEAWCKKPEHKSLRSRPGPRGNSWGVKSNRDYAVHLGQSFPGVGPELAGRIFDHFGRMPIQWEVTEEDLRKVPGIGKGKAKAIWTVLNGAS